jgi:hypothetical protein
MKLCDWGLVVLPLSFKCTDFVGSVWMTEWDNDLQRRNKVRQSSPPMGLIDDSEWTATIISASLWWRAWLKHWRSLRHSYETNTGSSPVRSSWLALSLAQALVKDLLSELRDMLVSVRSWHDVRSEDGIQPSSHNISECKTDQVNRHTNSGSQRPVIWLKAAASRLGRLPPKYTRLGVPVIRFVTAFSWDLVCLVRLSRWLGPIVRRSLTKYVSDLW